MDCVVPLRMGGGQRNPSVTSRCGSLLLSCFFDVRSLDVVIAFEGTRRRCLCLAVSRTTTKYVCAINNSTKQSRAISCSRLDALAGIAGLHHAPWRARRRCWVANSLSCVLSGRRLSSRNTYLRYANARTILMLLYVQRRVAVAVAAVPREFDGLAS